MALGLAAIPLCCSAGWVKVPDGAPTYSSCVMCSDQIYFINGRWMFYDLAAAYSLGYTPLIPVRAVVRRMSPGVIKVGNASEFAYYCDFDRVMKFDRRKEVPVCTSVGWGLLPRTTIN